MRRGDEPEKFVDLGIKGLEQATEIGRGGFSVVYRAWQPSFQRHVAVKVLSANLAASEVDRFARECAAIGSLQGHPNIVTVHGAGRRGDGQPFIVMEFLSEGSLAERLAQRPLAWATALDIGVKLAGALECAHGAGVLHRDVKPGNVMLSRFGECKLGDFGIARVEGRSETRSGNVNASWEHAPPEVVDGRRPSAASDVYSLASTLFALIDGRPPFARAEDESLVSLSARIVRDPVRRMAGDPPGVVERAVRRGLAKDPAGRPSTAAEFGRLLRAAQSQVGVALTPLPLKVDQVDNQITQPGDPAGSAPPPPPPGPTEDADLGPPPKHVRRWAWVAVGATMAVVAALLALTLNPDGGEEANGVSTSTSATSLATGPGTTAATEGTEASVPSSTDAEATPVGVRLGPDLPPSASEACHTPTIANGAAWQLGAVQLGGRELASAYYCNLFSGGTGSIDFVLGGTFRLLRLSIGFADGSITTGHRVRFEIIADGRDYLIDPPTLVFGEVQNLELDVTGVTQLRLRITELSPARGSGGSSRPVLGDPTLVAA